MILADIPLDQFTEIGRVGVVGAVAVLALWRVFMLEREKTTREKATEVEREKHKDELVGAYKEVGELMAQHTMTQQASNAGQEARTNALAAIADGMKAQAAGLKEIAAALGVNNETTKRTWDIITDAARSNRELRDAILNKVIP